MNIKKIFPVIIVVLLCLVLVLCLTVFSRRSRTQPSVVSQGTAGNPAQSVTGAADKMAFADFLLIYHSYYKTKLADEQLKKEGEEFQEKINADRDKMTALEEKVDSGILSEKEKESLNKEIGEIRMQITKNIQEFNAKIDNERKQEIDKLIEDLRAKLSNYGREKGYTMILDKNELIFSDPRLDLTKEIVDYINKDDK